ncbi:hypothetical protein [Xanthomonas bromi]|uniref:hypothetical protein n=1 Tax=Xanthomonas bromi TaxID=56449 RepID=UPI0011B0CD75|nr:hypothetical protein [Xanthomonas bromi]
MESMVSLCLFNYHEKSGASSENDGVTALSTPLSGGIETTVEGDPMWGTHQADSASRCGHDKWRGSFLEFELFNHIDRAPLCIERRCVARDYLAATVERVPARS